MTAGGELTSSPPFLFEDRSPVRKGKKNCTDFGGSVWESNCCVQILKPHRITVLRFTLKLIWSQMKLCVFLGFLHTLQTAQNDELRE